METIYSICGSLLGGREFRVPGLLFIDTPGHHAFTTLRARGGALADLAVLIIDIMEGFKPQTVESLNILKRYKTPFVVGANKIDLINGWEPQENASFMETAKAQEEEIMHELDDRVYKLVGELYKHGFQSERYDRVEDFTRSIAIVPMSAKTGECIPDMLMVLIGLAQKFLEEQLETEEGGGQGTVLEVKEERGLGTTVDTIIYNGTVHRGDLIVVGTKDGAVVTKVRALLKPKPLEEIRDPRERFESVKSVSAAVGVKISAQQLEGVLAGAPLRVADKRNVGEVEREVISESQIAIETAEEGVIIKADAIGSLEALAFELQDKKIPIKKVEVGDISRRDVVECSTVSDPLLRVILGFNVRALADAQDELETRDAVLFTDNVIYKLLEDYDEWYEAKKEELERQRRAEVVHPGMFKVLPDCVFRVSKPAVIGVRVLAGRIRAGQSILREDGRVIGSIKSIQSEKKSLKESIAGEEVAIAIPEVTVGRQLKTEDILYIDIPEADAKKLFELELTVDEREVLEKVCAIKRKEKYGWGM